MLSANPYTTPPLIFIVLQDPIFIHILSNLKKIFFFFCFCFLDFLHFISYSYFSSYYFIISFRSLIFVLCFEFWFWFWFLFCFVFFCIRKMDTLPQELLIRILTFLPIPSILNFCLANKNFLFLFDDNSLWKSLYFRDFGLYFWAPEIPKEILEKCDSINVPFFFSILDVIVILNINSMRQKIIFLKKIDTPKSKVSC